MKPEILETVIDSGYYASFHTPMGVLRLRITNPDYPGLENTQLQILTAEGHAAELWFETKHSRESLAIVLELMARRLRNPEGAVADGV